MTRMQQVAIRFIALLCLSITAANADLADELEDLEGWLIFTSSTVSGDFEGADYGKVVKLDNGMIFEFDEYDYTYAYRPTAVLLAKEYRGVIFYKLIVEDEVYDVTRLR